MFNWFKKKEVDISEPVTTIVKLIKEDIDKRFTIETDYSRPYCEGYKIKDNTLGEVHKIYRRTNFNAPYTFFTTNNVNFTNDECNVMWYAADDIFSETEKYKERIKIESQNRERQRLIELYCKQKEK